MKLLTNCALGAASAVPAAAAAPAIFDAVCDRKSATHIIKSYPIKTVRRRRGLPVLTIEALDEVLTRTGSSKATYRGLRRSSLPPATRTTGATGATSHSPA